MCNPGLAFMFMLRFGIMPKAGDMMGIGGGGGDALCMGVAEGDPGSGGGFQFCLSELVFRIKGSCPIRTHVFFSYSIDFL